MKRPALLSTLIALLLLGAGLLLFAACSDGGGDDEPDVDGTAPPAGETVPPPEGVTPGSVTATPSEPTTTIRASDTRGPVEGPGSGDGTSTLVDVRTEGLDGADRIIFEFQGGRAPYVIRYVQPPITDCGAGETVDVIGNGFLIVRFIGANAHNDAGEATVAELELLPALPSLLEADLICDFEADVQWALGLEQESNFTVTEQENPHALIIDISHP